MSIVKIENVVEVKRGLVVEFITDAAVRIGSLLGPYRVLNAERVSTCHFVCTCSDGHKDKVLALIDPTESLLYKGQELELTE